MTPLFNSFSAALLHFAWQGCLVLGLLWVTLAVLRHRSANARYAAGCAALALLAIAPLVTTYVLYKSPAPAGAGPVRFLTVQVLSGPAILPAASNPTASAGTIQSWALPVWAFGVLVFSLRMTWGCAQVAALRRHGQPAEDAVLAMVARLSQRMRVVRRVRVLVSEWAGGPSLVGWLRPVILIPASALAGLTPEQLEAVLAHELAHIRRNDYLVNCAQMVVETLLFYHPAVWWISSRIRHERELCCDDWAVTACSGALCYARALSTLEKMRAAAPLTALGSTDGTLSYRIRRIVGAVNGQSGPSRASITVAVSLALAGVVFGVSWARAQSQPTQDYLAQGDVLFRAGANEQALQKYAEGMKSDARNRAAYQKRSIEVLTRMGRNQEAAEVSAQLLKERPEDIDALAFGASALLERGDAVKAIEQLRQVLERAPDNPVAHFNLGLAYAARGDSGAARREMEAAVRLRPDFTRAQEALEKLAGLAALPGASASEYVGLATAQIAARNQQEELTLLQAESAKNPDRLDLVLAIGNLAARIGQYDLALYHFQKVLDRLDANSNQRGDIYLRIGETYRRKGDTGGAVQALQKARELIPGNREAAALLSLALEADGRTAEAAQLLAEVETVAANRQALTENFLKDELVFEQKRLEMLRAEAQADPERIRRAESKIAELRRRVSAAMDLQRPTGRVLAVIDTAVPESSALKLPVRIGDTLTADMIGATYAAINMFDESLEARFMVLEDGTVKLGIGKRR